MERINIFSKSPLVSQLILRVGEKKTKECTHLILVYAPYKNYFIPKCLKDYADQEENKNISTSSDHSVTPGHYYWPICPIGCPHYKKADNF